MKFETFCVALLEVKWQAALICLVAQPVRLDLATVGNFVAWSDEGQLGVEVRPEELPSYILMSRGSHQ
jgi:hypothetical protein